MYLFAGLPESYDVLVNALESGSDTVPALESVTESLLREEQKLKRKLMTARNFSWQKERRYLRVTTARSPDTSRRTARTLQKHS